LENGATGKPHRGESQTTNQRFYFSTPFPSLCSIKSGEENSLSLEILSEESEKAHYYFICGGQLEGEEKRVDLLISFVYTLFSFLLSLFLSYMIA